MLRMERELNRRALKKSKEKKQNENRQGESRTEKHSIGISSGVRRKFSWGCLVQGHMVAIWCALFLTSQFDVIFMFPNQRFGEVC